MRLRGVIRPLLLAHTDLSVVRVSVCAGWMCQKCLRQVHSAQLVRLATGFDNIATRGGAKVCLRTPRSSLKTGGHPTAVPIPKGGDWRKTFLKIEDAQHHYWVCTQNTWMHLCMKNPHGPVPFPAHKIKWMVTVFITLPNEYLIPDLEAIEPVSYTHLTLPTKRIV